MTRDLGAKGKIPNTSKRVHPMSSEEGLSDFRGQTRELDPSLGKAEVGRDLGPSFEADGYREIFEHSLSGCALHEVLFDDEGNLRDLILLEVNRAFQDITGLSASEVVGRRITETMPGIDLCHLRDAMAWLEAGDQEPYRFEQFVEGLGRYLEFAAIFPKRDQCTLFLADITDRQRAEKALEVQTVYFRELFERSPLAIVVLDNDDCVQECNEGFERLFGYPREVARGKLINRLLVRPEDFDDAHW